MKKILAFVSKFFKKKNPSPLVGSSVKAEPTEPKVVVPSWAEGLHPELVARVEPLLEHCAKMGMNVDVHRGLRTWEEQNRLYAKGRDRNGKKIGKTVTNARGGSSWHNYGLAVDVVFKTLGGRWSWAEMHPWSKLGKFGKMFGLEWGGDWKRFKDRPHFQYTCGVKIAEARRLYKSGGVQAVWKEIDRRAQ